MLLSVNAEAHTLLPVILIAHTRRQFLTAAQDIVIKTAIMYNIFAHDNVGAFRAEDSGTEYIEK